MSTGRLGTLGGLSSDALLWKSFFAAQGLLPKKVIREDLHVFPAADVSNISVGSFTRAHGRVRVDMGTANIQANYVWDLGANYNKVLIVMGGVRLPSFNICLTVMKTSPINGLGTDGWISGPDTFNNAFDLTSLPSFTLNGQFENKILPVPGAHAPNYGMALYIDVTTPRQTAWIKMGGEAPILFSDNALAGGISFARFAGIWLNNDNGQKFGFGCCPLGIWAE